MSASSPSRAAPAGPDFARPILKYIAPRRNIPGVAAGHLVVGRRGERLACRFLLARGFDVVARRFRGRAGEIDLVGFDGETLVFVEIKTRASREFGHPWEFVDWEKQRRLVATAQEFIARYDLGQYGYRFDIVSVVAPSTAEEEIVLYRNAF